MKKYIALLALIVALIIIGIGGNIWWGSLVSPVSNDTSEKDFLITKGLSASQVGTKLQKEGLARSSLAFRFYVQVTGKSKKIQAGEYSLSPSFSLVKTVDTLVKGPVEIWVTIPEGFRREEVAQKFASALNKDETFINEFIVASKGMEGYLFPDTYLFPKEASVAAIVRKMRGTFETKTVELKEGIEKSRLSESEIVTLASIIERETKGEEERGVVAGILINRLNIGMGLQADATVQYAVGTSENWWPILTKEDLTISSPYNTYKFRGLPPGPIANPGLSSLRAAIFPEESDYLYYLHDSKGQPHYAKTLEEHNENIAKFL